MVTQYDRCKYLKNTTYMKSDIFPSKKRGYSTQVWATTKLGVKEKIDEKQIEKLIWQNLKITGAY